MCAILDNSARDKVFRDKPSPANREFLKWIEAGRGRLVIGGEVTRELSKKEKVRKWLGEAEMLGIVKVIDDKIVDAKTAELKRANQRQRANKMGNKYNSDDPHVLALALESGARLLHAKDDDLEEDFLTRNLIAPGRGVIYPKGGVKGGHRRWLIKHGGLCRQ